MEQKTTEFIRSNALLAPGDRVICALSGGCDSVCLLLLMKKLQEPLQLAEVSALHIHHGIRGGEADRDEAFCRELCRKLDVPLTVRREDIPALAEESGESLEEAGRRRRLEIFAEEAKARGARVAAAHHRDDQAETVLMNLCRGTGPSGLAGMLPSRTDERGFTLIRPLLWAGKDTVRDWVLAQGSGWCEDSTNASGDNTRSRLRREILPKLEEIFPGTARHIPALAEKEAEQEAFLNGLAAEAFAAVRRPDGSLDIMQLKQQHAVLRRRVTALWLNAEGGLKDIGEAHYQALEDLLNGQSGRRTDLPGERTVLREQMRLLLIRRAESAGGRAGSPCGLPDEEGSLAQDFTVRTFARAKNEEIPKKKYTKWLDYDTITEPLCFRTRRKGDYLTLPGGGRQSLQDLFVNEKIPLTMRDEVPLAASGSHVLWAVGLRISAAAKITESTKTILEINYGGDHGKTSSWRSDQQ